MNQDLRPKIYLLVCVLALFLETGWMLAHAPTLCVKCKKPLATPSREYPTELCAACIEEIRVRLGAVPESSVLYDPPYPIDSSDPVVTLETTRGRVEIELFPKQAPVSTENFLRYVRGHHYDGVIFHRIEDYLCVSGRYRGGYSGAALVTIPQFAAIPSESGRGLDNRIGTIALPHLDENADSATSDFFFNLKDAPHYNRHGPSAKEAGYAVFGQVLRGYEVLDGMRFLPVTATPLGPGWEHMPRDLIAIRRAYESTPFATTGAVSALGSRTQTGR